MSTDPDDDLAREIREHLELDAEERMAGGASPRDAHHAARRAFGNVTRIREQARTLWVRSWLEHARHDLGYAARTLVRNPGFSTAALVTLALGIGANTAIFSVVHAIVLRPLPFGDSEQVVRITETLPPADTAAGAPRRMPALIAADVAALPSTVSTLSHVGVHMPTIRTLTGGDEPVRLIGARVSPDLLAMLNTRPQLGRTLERGEDAPGRDRVVVLSHATWQRHFGGRPDIVGQRATLDGNPHEIVGVMPRSFSFLDPRDEFWMPLAENAPMMRQRLPIIARVKDGISIDAAMAEMNAVVPRMHGESPVSTSNARFTAVRLRDLIAAPVRRPLLILAAAVGFVLLIACVNVANLLIARGMARQREMALRLALGAGRGRLVRQALTENLLLAVIGGSGGVALAFGGVALLRTLGTSLPRRDLGPGVGLPRLEEVSIDGAALVFTIAVSCAAGILIALLPAWRQLRARPIEALRYGPASTVAAGGTIFGVLRVQHLLVVSQIAMAMILLVGGGLLLHSFIRVSNISPGYDPAHVLTFQVSLAGERPDAELKRLAADLVERIASLPGVTAAGYAEGLPMTLVSSRRAALRMSPEPRSQVRRPPMRTFTPDTPDTRLVSRHFLAAMGIQVVEGRTFGDQDTAGQPTVLLINRTLARSGYLGPQPLGRYVYLFDSPYQVVGIVDDVRQISLTQTVDPQIFLDFRQVAGEDPLTGIGLYFGVRTDADSPAVAASIRGLVRQLDRQAMVENIAPMEQLVSNSIARPRLYAVMLAIFAAVAAILAAVGIFGVMAYAVTQRTREIGVRMSLGASRARVLRLVMRQTLALTTAGVLLGLGGAAALTRYLDQLLYDLTPLDPPTFVALAVTFCAVAMLAGYVPARRAATVDPVTALRCE
jgi:predicted permease